MTLRYRKEVGLLRTDTDTYHMYVPNAAVIADMKLIRICNMA